MTGNLNFLETAHIIIHLIEVCRTVHRIYRIGKLPRTVQGLDK
jgi:hypothetical protein